MQECILLRKEDIEYTLQASSLPGKHTLSPFSSFADKHCIPMRLIEDRNLDESEAEVHREEDDLWLCLEGKPTFLFGGELLDPYPLVLPDGTMNERHVLAKQIRGGNEITLKPGDWFWIPAGQPHRHTCEDIVRLLLIKIPHATH